MVETESAASFDLTMKMAPYWDIHLLFPVMKFLEDHQIYPASELSRVSLELLEQTDMIDYIEEVSAEMRLPPREELTKKRDDVLHALERYEQDSRGFVEALELFSAERQQVEELEATSSGGKITVAKLFERYADADRVTSFPMDADSQLFSYCKSLFKTGNYLSSAHFLNIYAEGVCEMVVSEGSNTEKKLSALWGSLASCILNAATHMNMPEDDIDENTQATLSTYGPDAALSRIFEIDSLLDMPNTSLSKREVRLHRVWLLHWMIWILFLFYLNTSYLERQAPAERSRLTEKKMKLLELFFHDKNLQLCQLVCPHLYRYYAVALILLMRKQELQIIVNGVDQTSDTISDPFTALLKAVHNHMDFEEARHQLDRCIRAAKVDFFLAPLAPHLEEQARLLIFESYCSIHSAIDLEMIAKRLAMRAEEAERWIVNLIRTSKLDAKIDSERNRVVIFANSQSIHQQVIEKTQQLLIKSQYLVSRKNLRKE